MIRVTVENTVLFGKRKRAVRWSYAKWPKDYGVWQYNDEKHWQNRE